MTHFDIAVVGGGPAGATTSLCLARMGWHVGIFERSTFEDDRLGETLPPEVSPVLRRLGLWEAFQAQSPLESPGIVSTWGSTMPVEVSFVSNAFGCGWHIDRKRFDQALSHEAVTEGATLFLNWRTPWKADDDGWRADDFRARFLVDATGRHGLMLGGRDARTGEDAMLAIVMRLWDGGQGSPDQRTWIEAAPAGWWYSTLLPGGTGLAMFFTGAEIYRQFGILIEEQLQAAPLARSRVNHCRVSPPRIAYAPCRQHQVIFGTSWAAVGDSASAYDPLSGQGIFKALRHAEAAAHAIDRTLRGDTDAMERYAAVVSREFETYTQQRRRFYSAEQRWEHHPFWLKRRG